MSIEIKLWFQDLLDDAARSIATEKARQKDPKATVCVARRVPDDDATPTVDYPYWRFTVYSDLDRYAPEIRVTVSEALRRVMEAKP